jgi:TonB family protein
VKPVLDHALSDLSEADREAILLRFFEGRPLAEVGAQLRLPENTARMRVERALDKLRLLLLRQGVNSTTGALAAALASQAVVAAPAGLSTWVSGAALASASAGGTVGVVMTFMSMSKLQLGILGAVAATGTTAFVVQSQTQTSLAQEITALRRANHATAGVKALSPTQPKPSAQTLRADAKSNNYDLELARLASETADLKKENAARIRVEKAAAAKALNAYNPAQLDKFPQPKTRVAPEYPKELMEAGITGEVLVEFVVDENGSVVEAFAASSSDQGFEAAAVAAVEKWKFNAGLKGGRPVNTRLQQPIAFAISEKTPPLSDWF